MPFNYFSANREAHPGSRPLRTAVQSKEWLKNLFFVLEIESYSIICNRDNNKFVVGGRFRTNPYFERALSDIPSCGPVGAAEAIDFMGTRPISSRCLPWPR